MGDEKKKALAAAMAAIEKQYGKGSVMVLGESKIPKMDVISSGCLSIDRAIGVGGYPKGRIIEIYGPESNGKCLTEDSYVLTATGYKTVKQIFNENGLDTFCVSKTVTMVYPLVNMNGEIENTTHFTFNGRKPTRVVSTESGTVINCTFNHPLRVLNKFGYPVWKKAGEIEKGDTLIGLVGTNVFGTTHIDNAYILGVLVADAYFGKTRISFTNDDADIKNAFKNGITSLIKNANILSYDNNDKGSVEYHINSKEFVQQFYADFGISSGKAKDKIVPEVIFNSDKETQVEFLKGFFDCEGSYTDGEIEVSSASEDLLKKVRLMLSNLGIQSSLRPKKAKNYPDNNYWRLGICGIDTITFVNVIGSNSNKVKSNYNKVLKRKTISRRIPYIQEIVKAYYQNISIDDRNRETNKIICDVLSKETNATTDILKKLLDYQSNDSLLTELVKYFSNPNLVYEVVSENEQGPEVPTFDFAMEKTHSFICEGIINHNTTVALHAIASCQQAGGTAAFIDAEHALDPHYAANLGVDVGSLIISQPDSGEQALDIAEQLIRSNAIDMIVVDSVAALVPQAELDGEMGDAFVGLQARMMSKAMRKLAGIISKSNCVAIFINQVREKIGVMYGNPETTGGGRALKFFSSVRLEVRRVEDIKVGTEKIGVRTKIKVVKNKVAPPFKEAIFEIHFGTGISQAADIIEIAVADGIIEKGGAWFNYKGQRFQGKDNLRKAIEEDVNLRTSLITDINNEEISTETPANMSSEEDTEDPFEEE